MIVANVQTRREARGIYRKVSAKICLVDVADFEGNIRYSRIICKRERYSQSGFSLSVRSSKACL